MINNHIFVAVLCVIFNVLVILNIAQSDYFGDDLYNFQISGVLYHQQTGIFDYTLESIRGWMDNGRLFPGALYVYILFDFLTSVLSYKIFVLFMIVLNVVVFVYFVYRVSGSKSLSLLVMLLIPIFFQYRYYHDPFLSFHGLMQLLFLYVILSFLLLFNYLEGRGGANLLGSVLLFSLSILTYEISYTFILFYLFIIWRMKADCCRLRNIVFQWMPYVMVAIILGLYTYYLRSNAMIESGPYLPSWDMWSIIKTYWNQTVSVIPISYYALYGNYPAIKLGTFIYLMLLIMVFLYAYYSWWKLRAKNYPVNRSDLLVLIGIFLMLLPGVLISLSTKFQGSLGEMNKVSFGLAYIPVYVQTFGFALFIGVIADRFRGAVGHGFFSAFLVVIISIHFISNQQVIDKVNSPYKDARQLLSVLFQGGFSTQLNDSDTIQFLESSPLHTKEYLSLLAGKKIEVVLSDSNKYDYRIEYDVAIDSAIFNVHSTDSGRDFIIMFERNNGDWVDVYNELSGSSAVDYVKPVPIYKNFYPWEGGAGHFRWAAESSSIALINSNNSVVDGQVIFHVGSLINRELSIKFNGNSVETISVVAGVPVSVVLSLVFKRGKNVLEFYSDKSATDPSGPDDRKLLFSVSKVKMSFRMMK